MEDDKPWYYSRTIWGALIAVIAPVMAVFDLPLSPSLQSELAENIVLFIGAIGGVVALLGRVFAKSHLR